MEVLKKQADSVINEFITSEQKYNDIHKYVVKQKKKGVNNLTPLLLNLDYQDYQKYLDNEQ